MNAAFKRIAMIVADTVIIWTSIYCCYYLRFDGAIPENYSGQLLKFGAAANVVFVASLYISNLYRRIWRYASIDDMVSLVKAVLVGCVLTWAVVDWWTREPIPLSVAILSFESMLLLMGGIRLVRRAYIHIRLRSPAGRKNAVIIGAGACGIMVARKLDGNKEARMRPVAFIDDDPIKRGREVCGLPVIGGRDCIQSTVKRYAAEEIVIAMPSASRKEISKIIECCKSTKANLKIIPRIDDLIHGRLSTNEIRNVEVEDLLGRDPVNVDLEGIADYVQGKTVLVTGAGGSIGAELCRQIARFGPKRLIALGHGENSIHAIGLELRDTFPELLLEPVIADVQDRMRLEAVFKRFGPQVVFHAAAHKHVPLMELNPSEAIKNNVFGTKNVAECADLYGAERFVFISTDKAVNPTSVMGATKRIAEMFIQCLDKQSATKFVAVRFGNVLGSRGSVIPQFKRQIAAGGPVTVTHPEMIRYFMTIPEAVQLVIQAGAFADGGEIFVLDMGKPVKIVDLAKDLIRLSGFEPYVDIDIVFSGIRPGEKLYEELLTSEEGATATKHARIFIGQPSNMNRPALELEIKMLEKTLGEEHSAICEMIKHIVPTYQNVS